MVISACKTFHAKKICLAAVIATALLFSGCDSGTPNNAPAAKPTPAASELQTGRFALQKMLVPAHFWAPDAQPVRLESSNMQESNGHDGKAGFWRALFASPSRQKSESFSWSGVSTADTKPGIDHGTEDSYNPASRTSRTFDLNFLRIDTDKAFEVAQEHGGKELLAKAPKTAVTYLLDWDTQSSQLRWHVIYGGNEATSKLTVVVDANTGRFLHKE